MTDCDTVDVYSTVAKEKIICNFCKTQMISRPFIVTEQ